MVKPEEVSFLESDRLKAVMIDEKNTLLYQKWCNDPQVRNLTTEVIPYNNATMDEIFKAQKEEIPEPILCELRLKENNEPIGLTGAKWINWVQRSADPYLVLDPAYWGKGYGTEACELLCRLTFHELNLFNLYFEIPEFNKPMQRVLEKIGFVLNFKMREFYQHQGEYCDKLFYSIKR